MGLLVVSSLRRTGYTDDSSVRTVDGDSSEGTVGNGSSAKRTADGDGSNGAVGIGSSFGTADTTPT